ncbi:related to sister chromatid cohesion Ctf8 [Lecanosticta acicola]|uniref:Related to sister chromatid cohesion Ctf8 n=1 Tax=Lecanosticta acicola TaxID=111012 RepID=A0AAI8Z409_9PEZI|nr:related to sister chromatid cohesion Ctf8 [Lecanosticta acicola]
MPSVPLHPPIVEQRKGSDTDNALPPLLHTPSGLAMIELQGSVLSEDEHIENVSTALRLGKLVFPEEDGVWDGKKVFLFVGSSPERTHQRMAGEVKKLVKPVAVLRRRTTNDDRASSGTGDEVEIAEVVRHKIIFSHRPEPLGGGEHLLEEP